MFNPCERKDNAPDAPPPLPLPKVVEAVATVEPEGQVIYVFINENRIQ